MNEDSTSQEDHGTKYKTAGQSSLFSTEQDYNPQVKGERKRAAIAFRLICLGLQKCLECFMLQDPI